MLQHRKLDPIRQDPTSQLETRTPRHVEVLDGVANELMPPVWALGMQLSALRLPADLTPRERRFVEDVERHLGRIVRVLAGAHDFVLAETDGELPLVTRRCEMGAICEEAVEQLRELGVDDPIAVDGYGSGAGVWDPHRLAQAISYLVEAALAAAPADTVIRVRWRGTEGEVLLVVDRDARPEDAAGARIDPDFGAAAGTGPEDGVRTFVARKILDQHGATLARFATDETVTLVAVIPRTNPALA